ncbi:phage tail tape measure protein, partial [Escherichia coli]
VSNISDALAGNVVDWRNWGSSVLREVSKILMNAAIVNGLKSLSGAGGWLGTVGGWISGAVANAKGGSPVYHISIQNQGSNGEIDARSARGLVDLIDSRVVSIMQSSRRDGGLYSA